MQTLFRIKIEKNCLTMSVTLSLLDNKELLVLLGMILAMLCFTICLLEIKHRTPR